MMNIFGIQSFRRYYFHIRCIFFIFRKYETVVNNLSPIVQVLRLPEFLDQPANSGSLRVPKHLKGSR